MKSSSLVPRRTNIDCEQNYFRKTSTLNVQGPFTDVQSMLSVNMELARVPLVSKHHMSHLDRADIRATLVFGRLYESLLMEYNGRSDHDDGIQVGIEAPM